MRLLRDHSGYPVRVFDATSCVSIVARGGLAINECWVMQKSHGGLFYGMARGGLLQKVGPRGAGAARHAAKVVCYYSGMLDVYHRLRNGNVLTVVTFHRLLMQDDVRADTALAQWSMTPAVFDQCLAFFARHYVPVSIADVLAAQKQERALPRRSLLVTFDDGYADNVDYALPLLKKHRVPALFFVSSDVLDKKARCWTEELLWMHRAGKLAGGAVAAIYGALFGDAEGPASREDQLLRIVRAGPLFTACQVRNALAQAGVSLPEPPPVRQMMNRDDLVTLVRSGMTIGAHGKTHAAMTMVGNLDAELKEPRDRLSAILSGEAGSAIQTLSFPHGAHTPTTIRRAVMHGYRLVFTTKEVLATLERGAPHGNTLGRVNMDETKITRGGTFSAARLACALFTKPHCGGDQGGMRPTKYSALRWLRALAASISPFLSVSRGRL
jgi:peptidoglycan/xylan/chitin deacetylase (PgdA/CDA1 family)